MNIGYDKKLVYAIGIVFFFLISRVYAQTTVNIAASKDNTLYEDATGSLSNGAGQNFFAGHTSQLSNGVRRGLIAFDVSNAIPVGAEIQSVTLTLHLSRGNASTQTIELRQVLADWGEGTSNAGTGGQGPGEGDGIAATTGDATWVHRFFNTETWTNPGGDFSATVSASQAVGGIRSYTWGSTTQMVADVQAWVDNPEQNFGWILLGNEGTSGTSKAFDTKENTVAANQPVLTVTYSDPTGVSDGGQTLPTEFRLAQNYPNPFNPNTVIAYTIPQSITPVKVTLEIFNLLGQKVHTLVNAEQASGSYNVQWHGTDARGNLLPGGVYIYRLQAGTDFVDVKKMVFMK